MVRVGVVRGSACGVGECGLQWLSSLRRGADRVAYSGPIRWRIGISVGRFGAEKYLCLWDLTMWWRGQTGALASRSKVSWEFGDDLGSCVEWRIVTWDWMAHIGRGSRLVSASVLRKVTVSFVLGIVFASFISGSRIFTLELSKVSDETLVIGLRVLVLLQGTSLSFPRMLIYHIFHVLMDWKPSRWLCPVISWVSSPAHLHIPYSIHSILE